MRPKSAARAQTILRCVGAAETGTPEFVLAWNFAPARIPAFHLSDLSLEPLQEPFSNTQKDGRFSDLELDRLTHRSPK